MKKKLFTLLLGSLLSLTACGGGSEPTKHEVDQFLPSDDPSSTKTIKFWHCLGQAKTDNLERVVTEFNKTYNDRLNKTNYLIDGEQTDWISLAYDIESQCAFAMDIDTKEILFEKNKDRLMSPASTTKLMTNHLVSKYGRLIDGEEFLDKKIK